MTRNNSLIVPLTPEDSAITLDLFASGSASTYNIVAEDNEACLVAYLVEHAGETKSFTESEADLDTPDDPFFDDPNYAEENPCIYCGTPTDGLICSDKCQREHFGL